jgi:hypothetical protein
MNDLAETRLAKRRGGLNGKSEDKVRAGQIGGKNASPEGILGKIQSGIESNALMPRGSFLRRTHGLSHALAR